VSDQSEEFDRLWGQAIEEHVAGLSDTDFTALVERARPKPVAAMNYRELRENIAKKSNEYRARTRGHANGGAHIAASLTTHPKEG
jgi:hypothetical protein